MQVYNGGVDDWIRRIDTLVARYGSNALFFYFPPMTMADADKLMSHAEKNWKDIEGTFR